MTSRDGVKKEGEKGGRGGEKREEGRSERDIMRHSDPAWVINPTPSFFEQLIQPTADNKPTLGLHTHTHKH